MSDMTSTATPPPPCIATDLERSRLEHRARRIERALLVLRGHRDRADVGRRPPALEQAIAEFGEELGAVKARLRELRPH
jgi:hypothetical protein